MRPSIYTALALVARGLQASERPSHQRQIIYRLGLVRPGRIPQPEREIHQLVARNRLRKPLPKAVVQKNKKKHQTVPNPPNPTDLLHFYLPRRRRRAELVVR
jgi:hypothetical protein